MKRIIQIFLITITSGFNTFSQEDTVSKQFNSEVVDTTLFIGYWKFQFATDLNNNKINKFYHGNDGGYEAYEYVKRTDYYFYKDGRFNSNQIISNDDPLSTDSTIGRWTYNAELFELIMIYDELFYPFPMDMSESHKQLLIESKAIQPTLETFINVKSVDKNKLVLTHNTYSSGVKVGEYLLIYEK